MSNIATGIGLSGALESDASGQDSRVEAAKFGAMTRLAKKKEEEEQKKSLEKEVRKNIIVDNKLDNEFYQDQFSDRAASEISEIIGGYSSGEMTEAEVWNRVQGFKNFSGKIHSADKELTSSKAKIEKDPFNYDWRDTKTVGGKDVNSFFEAVNNNPLARTEEGFNELQELYPGAEYSFIKSTPEDIKRGAPEFVVKYDPMPMLNPKDIVAEIAKDQKRFTTPFIGEAMPVKDEKGFDKWIAPVGTKMNEAVLEEAVNNALEDPQIVFGLQRYYEAQLRREYKKNNPDKSERDFMDSDWQNEIPKLLERDLVNPLREMVANQGYREVTKTKPIAAKPTSAQKFAETHFGGSTYTRDGNELRKTLPATDQVERWFLVPDGSTFFTGTGEGERSQRGTVKTKDGVRLKVSPQEVVWNTKDLSKSRIVLLSNMDENMRESSKRTYTYEVPLDAQTFGRLAEMFKTTKEDAMGILLRDADAGAVGDIKKWAKSLGMDASQIPGPGTGQSSTPASGSITIELNGKTGSIPAENWEAFKKKYPNAIRK